MGRELPLVGACGVLFTGGTRYAMLHPPLEAFSDRTRSRYSLVVATAKRARQLVNGAKSLVETKSDKPVTVAMEEILAGKVSFEELGSGTK
jgi:DNA-directed RNA polymerase subunit omega